MTNDQTLMTNQVPSPNDQPFGCKSEFAWALVVVMVCAVISLVVSWQSGAFALLFAVMGWWVWLNPAQSFLFLLVLAPLLPMVKATQTIGTITLIKDVIIAVLFIRVFLYPLVMKKLPYRRNYMMIPVIALVLWTAMAGLRADSTVLGILRFREIVLYVLMYFVALYLPVSRRYWLTLAGWLTGAAIVVVLLGWYQWIFAPDSAVLRFDPVRKLWIPRMSSTLGHPSVYGHFLMLAGAWLLAASIYVKQWRVWLLLGVATLLPAIYLTYSRAVWLGVAAVAGGMVALFLADKWKKFGKWQIKWRPVAGTAVIGIFVVLMMLRFTSAGTFLKTAIDPTYASNEDRLIFIARLVSPLSNWNAVTGMGLGDVVVQNFREVDITGYDVASGSGRDVQLAKDNTLVDNQFVKTLVEMGILGLVVYGWIYWTILKAAWEAVRHKQASVRMVGLASIGFLTLVITQSLFIDVWDIFPTNLAFWAVAGVMGATLTPAVEGEVS